MERKYSKDLQDWKTRDNRKPLILRGARQVGKTYLVRDFATQHFKNIIEINFDRDLEKAELFKSKKISAIIDLLEIEYETEITPGETLLFLDEIQAAPQLIHLLRYFYEEYSTLHVIAAGSLLDFELAEHEYSMPVGRIEYMFIGPMDFYEFLKASGNEKLVRYLQAYELPDSIPQTFHKKLLELLKTYYVIGGLPAAVKQFVNGKMINAVREQKQILQTYFDDFSKYREKVNIRCLQKVLNKAPHLIGSKVKFVNIDREEKSKDLSDALNLLQLARVLYKVHHSSGNGIPLRAEVNFKYYKLLYLDIGLMLNALGIKASELQLLDDADLVNKGALTEQFIGQQIYSSQESYIEPELHYWVREKRGSSSEIDYLISKEKHVVPVEIKAGKTGTLKSLQNYIAEKAPTLALRFNSDLPSEYLIEQEGNQCKLISLPLYLVLEASRLCK